MKKNILIFILGQAYPVTRANLLITVAHEYGHAIFQQFLKKRYAVDFSDLFTTMEDLSTRKEIAASEGKIDSALAEDSQKMLVSPKYQDFKNLFVPYAEFFADCVAVFTFKDKNAMVNALYYDEMSNQDYQYIKMRDFDGEPNAQYSAFLSEEHSKLAYVRSYVGQYLWPQKHKDIFPIEKKILTAIDQVTQRYLKTKELEPSVAQANQDLIAALSLKP